MGFVSKLHTMMDRVLCLKQESPRSPRQRQYASLDHERGIAQGAVQVSNQLLREQNVKPQPSGMTQKLTPVEPTPSQNRELEHALATDAETIF